MKMSNTRARYTVNDVLNNRFYQIPKFLFGEEFKKELGNDAKILYALLRDRHELSVKNKWFNNFGEIYLIYSREEMADMLGVTQPTVRKAIQQLKNCALLEEEQIGQNKANRIYLIAVSIETTGQKNSFSPESRNEKSFQSGVKNSFSPECKIFSPNDTDINNTEYNDTNLSINHSTKYIDISEEENKNSREMDGRIDPKKYIESSKSEMQSQGKQQENITYSKSEIEASIRKNKQIPLEYCNNIQNTEQIVDLLTAQTSFYGNEEHETSIGIFKAALAEILAEKNLKKYGDRKLSNKNILEKINANIIIAPTYIIFQGTFIEETLDDFMAGISKTKVLNFKGYMKTCIVNSLDTHRIKYFKTISDMGF